MTDDPVAFGELDLPPVGPGQTYLVTGPSRLAGRLARRLTLLDPEDGALLVSTTTAGSRLAAEVGERFPAFDRRRLGIVDASGRRDTGTGEAAIERASGTADLTGISIGLARLDAALRTRGVDRIRTCIDSLSMLLLYTNFKTMSRFVHVMSGRVAATGGFGAFVLDPGMHDEQVAYTFAAMVDGRIEIAPGEDGQRVRIDGGEWRPVDPL